MASFGLGGRERAERGGDARDLERAAGGVEQRDGEHQERRRHAGEHQVLEAGLERHRQLAQVGGHHEQTDREQLEPEEQRGQVAARHQRDRAQRGEQERGVELFALLGVAREVAVREPHHADRAEQHEAGEVDGEAVDHEQRKSGRRGRAARPAESQRGERERGGGGAGDGAVKARRRGEEQRHHRSAADHQPGQERLERIRRHGAAPAPAIRVPTDGSASTVHCAASRNGCG